MHLKLGKDPKRGENTQKKEKGLKPRKKDTKPEVKLLWGAVGCHAPGTGADGSVQGTATGTSYGTRRHSAGHGNIPRDTARDLGDFGPAGGGGQGTYGEGQGHTEGNRVTRGRWGQGHTGWGQRYTEGDTGEGTGTREGRGTHTERQGNTGREYDDIRIPMQGRCHHDVSEDTATRRRTRTKVASGDAERGGT